MSGAMRDSNAGSRQHVISPRRLNHKDTKDTKKSTKKKDMRFAS
jgi:hypothetical protein